MTAYHRNKYQLSHHTAWRGWCAGVRVRVGVCSHMHRWRHTIGIDISSHHTARVCVCACACGCVLAYHRNIYQLSHHIAWQCCQRSRAPPSAKWAKIPQRTVPRVVQVQNQQPSPPPRRSPQTNITISRILKKEKVKIQTKLKKETLEIKNSHIVAFISTLAPLGTLCVCVIVCL